jgi:hypothetical protein
MPDLDELFRRAKQLPAPGLWSDVLRRADGAEDLPVEDASTYRGPLAGRIVAGVVAFAIFVAAAVFMWSEFRAGPSTTVDVASGSSVTPSLGPSANYRYLFPFFQQLDGWHVHDSGLGPADSGSTAWASSIPFDPADLEPTAPAIPPNTIEQLPPEGIVLTAEVVPSAYDPTLGPWPPGSLDRLRLADAVVRAPNAEEPEGTYAVYEIDGPYVLLRVYFGSADPSQATLGAAQSVLDTLEVPPVCPVPAEGSFPDSMQVSPTDVRPGESVSVSALMPFQREDGSYDRMADGVVELWWDADPDHWEQLAGDPAATGATLLATGGEGSCFLSATLTVPTDASPGDHQIVALETNTARDSATSWGSFVLHVTA